jgi:hypothetical protein
MTAYRLSPVMASLALLAPLSAAPAEPGPKVGDRLAAYTPSKNLNPRGRLKCETC